MKPSQTRAMTFHPSRCFDPTRESQKTFHHWAGQTVWDAGVCAMGELGMNAFVGI